MATAYDIRERRVHIRGLTLNAQVKVYEEELPQRLLLDLELVVQLTDSHPTRSIRWLTMVPLPAA